MDHFLANILLAIGVATTPANLPRYELFGTTELFGIEVDLNSFRAEVKAGGWQVKANIRRLLLKQVSVPGKEKKGAYYLDSTTVSCARDTFTVDTTSLHAADGEVLGASSAPLTFQNPLVEDNFVSKFLEVICNSERKAGKIITA